MIRRVLYACTQDPSNVQHWSGTIHYMGKALAESIESVEPWLIPTVPRPFFARWRARSTRRLFRCFYIPEWEIWFARACSRLIDERLSEGRYDAVLSHAPRVFAYSESAVPAFAFSDAVFPNLLNYYPGFDRVRPRTVREVEETERLGIEHCRRFFVSSEWARAATMAGYRTPGDRVSVMPLGANMDPLPPSAVTETVRSRIGTPCRLLFLGVEWARKGGDLAVDAAKSLIDRGVAVELVIVGCDPPAEVRALPFVQSVGFLDKRDEAHRAKLTGFLDGARFLIMPSRAEAYGIAVAEAYCRAVPAVAANTGGLTSLVRNGVTGFLVPREAGGKAYAEAMLPFLSDQAAYEAMCLAAYEAARTEFNWTVVGQHM